MNNTKNIVQQGDTICVWFSSGAASAVAAKKTIEKYGDICNIIIVNNPVKEEHEDNVRFLNDVSKWIGKEVVIANNSKFPTNSIIDVFNYKKYMSGVLGAPCTMLLKKEARYQFELSHRIDWHVLGFTFDEKHRFDRFVTNERENTLPILIDLKLTKGRCFQILEEAGINLPLIYKLGFPNANCIACVKSSSPTYWNHVRKTFPEVFNQRVEQSEEIGCKLVKVKGERIMLKDLKVKDKGGKMKSFECGIFCDTE